MKIIDTNPFVIFPIAFDDICRDMDSLLEIRRNNSSIMLYRLLTETQMQLIYDYIVEHNQDEHGKYYILDLSYVDMAGDRIFDCLKELGNIMIINVGFFPSLIGRIDEDLPGYIKKDEGWFSSNDVYEVYEKNKNHIENIYNELEVDIVRSYTNVLKRDQIDGAHPLPSSNIYSNMYIDTAQLFYNVENYRYMIFRLLCKICENEKNNFEKIDGFVSASRNGANLANIIGWLTGKKAIFCTDLGPKYSLTLKYFVDDIRPKKKYVYIFDFLCLGTEAKMLNAIVNVKNATLTAGYGLASYTDHGEGILRKMHSIVNLKEEGFGYKITGEKEALGNILVGEEEYANKQYIYEV